MKFVKPKKSLGQHFLKDNNIANKIVDSLDGKSKYVLELGPGMGVLTKFLLKKKYNLSIKNFKFASMYGRQNISLPVYPKLKIKQVDKICKTILKLVWIWKTKKFY